MKILLDECCPRQLRRALVGFDVESIEYAGLKGLKNGALLAVAEQRFAVLITADKRLRYQQNLRGRKLAIIELPTNFWEELKPRVPAIAAALARIKPGGYVSIPGSETDLNNIF